MDYFFYSLDIDVLDIIKEMKNNSTQEDILIELKTNGDYLISYSEKEYYELIGKLGNNVAKILNNDIIDLVQLKELYSNIQSDFNDEIIRKFKLTIFKPISECKCIYIIKMEKNTEENNSDNIFNNFKAKIKEKIKKINLNY